MGVIMAKSIPYSFRLNPGEYPDEIVIPIIEAWREQGYTVKQIVSELVLANEGIEFSPPYNRDLLARAIREQVQLVDEVLEELKAIRAQNPAAFNDFARQGLPQVTGEGGSEIDEQMIEAIRKARRGNVVRRD